MRQTNDLRGRLAFIEDMIRIAVLAFTENNQAEVEAALMQVQVHATAILEGLAKKQI